MQKPFPHIKLLEFGLIFFLYQAIQASFASCLFFTFDPTVPNLPGNVIPSSWPLIIRFHLVYILPCYTVFIIYLNLYVISYAGLVYSLLIIPFIVKELRLGCYSYHSISHLRLDSSLLSMEYRSAQLLHEVGLMQILGQFLIPTQWLCTLIFVLSSTAIILYGPDMDLAPCVLLTIWIVIPTLAWSLVMVIGGYLRSNCSKLLNSWKYRNTYWANKKEMKVMNKFRLSCEPLAFHHRKMYVIKEGSLMVFYRHLVRGLMRAILTLRS